MANPNDKNKDAGDPRTSGQPEQFLQEAPAHLAAQGDKAPPMPNAAPARRYFRLHDKGGAMLQTGPVDPQTKRAPRAFFTAGSVFPLDPAVAAMHGDMLTEVDASGQPLGAAADRIAARQTGEASVPQKR